MPSLEHESIDPAAQALFEPLRNDPAGRLDLPQASMGRVEASIAIHDLVEVGAITTILAFLLPMLDLVASALGFETGSEDDHAKERLASQSVGSSSTQKDQTSVARD